MWMRVGIPASLPESLYLVSKQWRAEEEEGKVNSSLQVLGMNLWVEIAKRLDPANLSEKTGSCKLKRRSKENLRDGQLPDMRGGELHMAIPHLKPSRTEAAS